MAVPLRHLSCVLSLALLGWCLPAQARGPEAHFRLPGGIEMVVAQPDAESETGFALAWPVGYSSDPSNLHGASWALIQGLWQGGEHPLLHSLKALGGRGEAECFADHSILVGKLPKNSAPAWLARMGESLAKARALGPSIPPVGLAASELGQMSAAPKAIASLVGMGLALGPAYAAPPMGWPSQWAAWNGMSLAAVARQALAPASLRLAFAGGSSSEALVGPAVRAFAPLAQSEVPATPGVQAPFAPLRWRSPGGRSIAVVGMPGPGLAAAPNEAGALVLLARVLAERLPGLLKALPGEARPILCHYEAMGTHGAFLVAASCSPGQGEATQEALHDALDTLVKGPITLTEWAQAQRTEAELAEAALRLPEGRARALVLGLIQAKRPGWDEAYPAVLRQLSRPALATAAQSYLGSDGRRSAVLNP